jgi:hypothetical protein
MANSPEHPSTAPIDTDASPQTDESSDLPLTEEVIDRGLAIVATPGIGEQVVFRRSPDGGISIKFTGEVQIAFSRPIEEPHEESPQESDNGAPAEVANEYGVVTRHVSFSPAPESDLTPSDGQGNGKAPDGQEAPQQPAQSGSETEDKDAAATEGGGIFVPESENRRHEFVGNPVRDAKYWVRRSGKRVADFHIATHPKKDETRYYRIRSFDDLADRVRDNVRQGQKDVQVVAYGPKYWKGRKKTKTGEWQEELVQGYYAGFVHAPEKPQKEKGEE